MNEQNKNSVDHSSIYQICEGNGEESILEAVSRVRLQRDRLLEEREELEARVEQAERDKLRAIVNSKPRGFCTWCKAKFDSIEEFQAHVAECNAHPLHPLAQERDDLCRRLGEAVEALKQLDKCAQDITGKELRERMYGIVASVLDSAPSPAPEPAPAPAMLAPPASIVNAPIEKATFTEVRHLLSPAPVCELCDTLGIAHERDARAAAEAAKETK